jgi:hypothetical protein
MESPGEKLVTRLWETIAEKGIGNIFMPAPQVPKCLLDQGPLNKELKNL